MSYLSSLLASPIPSEASTVQRKSYVTYTMPDSNLSAATSRTVTLLESSAVISCSGTTGMRTWEAALHLGHYLASPAGRSEVAGKTVFELGAGTGFLSILCAKYLAANHVLATDGHEDVVSDLRANASFNGLDDASKISAQIYRWGGGDLVSLACPDDCDVVLGADLVRRGGLWSGSISDI